MKAQNELCTTVGVGKPFDFTRIAILRCWQHNEANKNCWHCEFHHFAAACNISIILSCKHLPRPIYTDGNLSYRCGLRKREDWNFCKYFRAYLIRYLGHHDRKKKKYLSLPLRYNVRFDARLKIFVTNGDRTQRCGRCVSKFTEGWATLRLLRTFWQSYKSISNIFLKPQFVSQDFT